MKKEYLELYTDYLMASFGQTTATGLSEILDGEISHDKITRFLSKEDYTSKELWQIVKKEVRAIEEEDGVSLPIAFELVKKPIVFVDPKTNKQKRKSEVTKNELLREMLKTCQKNQVKWRYLLTDSWFTSSENMKYVNDDLKKYFILALKSNRLVALSEEDKKGGCYTRIDELDWLEKKPIKGWIKGLKFPILLHRQIFTNKDGSTGILYLISNDLDLTATKIETIYQKRWKVEVFHKNIKSNTALAKSPTITIRTQSNHIFMSIYASAKLEILAIKNKMNTFALRSKIYIASIKSAFSQLQALKVA